MRDIKPGSLEDIFYQSAHRPCIKWAHYFDIYEEHFARFRGQRMTFVEIGVAFGGSMDIWREYFGSRAHIIGVDVDPERLNYAGPQVDIVIGDQGDPAFLADLAKQIGTVDVVLDDGGHRMDQQILTFEHLYPLVNEGGVYMCEDTHTSYDPGHGGGLGDAGTFIEYMKRKVDDLHSWYHTPPGEQSLARTAHNISFYDSIVTLRKRAFTGPQFVEVGYKRASAIAR